MYWRIEATDSECHRAARLLRYWAKLAGEDEMQRDCWERMAVLDAVGDYRAKLAAKEA